MLKLVDELFGNRHKGETAVIVANGPSLNKTDFSLLKDVATFGLNKIYLGFERFQFYPKYYVAVNEKVLRQSVSEISSMNCVKFLSQRVPSLFENNAITHLLDTSLEKERFSTSFDHGVNEGWTVTYVALQIAYLMGFSKVILIGLDHRFEFEGAPNQSQHMVGKDVNHFSDQYFADQDWDNPDLQRSEESFTVARTIFEGSGRVVLDATIGGGCAIFPKVSLEEALYV
jgi:hypothetical protein